MKMKNLIVVLSLSISLFANTELNLQETDLKLNHQLIKDLKKQKKDADILKLFKSDEVDNLTPIEKFKKNYKYFENTIESFNVDTEISSITNKIYKDKMSLLKDKNAFTLTFFITEDISLRSVKRFTDEIDVLKSYFPNIQAKLFFNNYPKHYVNEKKSSITSSFGEMITKNTAYGKFKLQTDGNWKYLVNSNVKLVPNKSFTDLFIVKDIYNYSHSVELKLKTNSEGILKIEESFNPKGMYRYMQELMNYGIKSENFKIHVHPWAFKNLELKKVPAYLLSYCDNDNYRYKQCDNKYLIRGDISLYYFFNQINKNKKEYESHEEALLKGMKYD